jgi:threonine/homoserine/homoserine lactone efflux protein
LIQAKALGPAAVAALYLGYQSADFSWNTLLSTATNAVRRWLTSSRNKALIIFTGGFMIYIGLVFFRSAFPVM